jgi:hypothetical protein
VELLEDKSHRFAAEPSPGAVAEFLHRLTQEPKVPAAGQVQQPEQVQQCGLAAPGPSHNGRMVAAVNGEVHAAQNVELLVIRQHDGPGHSCQGYEFLHP